LRTDADPPTFEGVSARSALPTSRTLLPVCGVVVGFWALYNLGALTSGHGLGAALAGRLASLLLVGLAYGFVYALTRNLWLVALVHATMNYPPVLFAVNVPSDLHLVVALAECVAVVSVVFLTVRVARPDGPTLVGERHRSRS
jgi:membrane protease YdiL (CAAX protease family)